MSYARKSSLELDQFYQNLNRIQRSLGKAAPRSTTSSLNKNSNIRREDQNRTNTMSQFKKQLHSKGLIKSKIKLERKNQKPKMSQATQYEQLLNSSDHPAFSQQFRNTSDDPFERVKNKLDGWKRKERQTQGNYRFGKQEENSIVKENKENIDISFQNTTDKHFPVFDQHQQQKQTQNVNNKLMAELTKRNTLYKIVQNNLPQPSTSKTDLSLKLQDHFRTHTTMKNIITQFKKISNLDIQNLEQLYSFLKSNQNRQSQNFISSSQWTQQQ